MDEDVEVTGSRAIRPSFAFARNPNARAFIHARRNIYGYGFAFILAAFARTDTTWVFDNLTPSMTGRACPFDNEETLLRAHLAVTRAQIATALA
jgi:hypothetical protein